MYFWNVELAYSAYTKLVSFLFNRECGIEPLLELEDIMACSVPEPKSLMTYVHFVYQFFIEGPKERTPPPGWDDDDEDDDDWVSWARSEDTWYMQIRSFFR